MKILISDYDMIRKDPGGYYFASETTEGDLIISNGGQFVIKYVKDGVLSINGFSYSLKTESEHELGSNFLDDTENIFESAVNSLYKAINRNVFTANSDIILNLRTLESLYRTRFMQLKKH